MQWPTYMFIEEAAHSIGQAFFLSVSRQAKPPPATRFMHASCGGHPNSPNHHNACKLTCFDCHEHPTRGNWGFLQKRASAKDQQGYILAFLLYQVRCLAPWRIGFEVTPIVSSAHMTMQNLHCNVDTHLPSSICISLSLSRLQHIPSTPSSAPLSS